MPIASPFQNTTKASLSKRIDAYFDQCKSRKTPPSMTGLALHLDTTRRAIYDYGKTDEFGDIIERAKLRCENVLEERMINGTPPTGIIFILKNNYGWHDKVEVDQTINGTISLSTLFDKAKEMKELQEAKVIDGTLIEDHSDKVVFDTLQSDKSHQPDDDLFAKHGEESKTTSSQLPDELFT